jgi:hypothetical protein
MQCTGQGEAKVVEKSKMGRLERRKTKKKERIKKKKLKGKKRKMSWK